MKPYPLLFNPVFKQRVWGGTRLKDWFRECSDTDQIGEAWILSDHQEGKSTVSNGPYTGKTLSEVIEQEPDWFGPDMKEFPLLFKVIDAAKDLSVQVHPDDVYAYEHAGERGKTECWWVLDAAQDAKIVYGHHAQTRQDFEQAEQADKWDDVLKYSAVSPGDFRFVPAGKVHALGAGTMVLEVQQSSDTTYRVYDYKRPGTDGKLRPLHLEDALNVIPFPDTDDSLVSHVSSGTSLASCPYFEVEKWEIDGKEEVLANQVLVIAPTDNSATLSFDSESLTLEKGHAVLLPKGVTVTLAGRFTGIVTKVPDSESK
nr:type I phosphomannose isomerase catalytic subunit [Alicyclobacillus sp. SO9]